MVGLNRTFLSQGGSDATDLDSITKANTRLNTGKVNASFAHRPGCTCNANANFYSGNPANSGGHHYTPSNNCNQQRVTDVPITPGLDESHGSQYYADEHKTENSNTESDYNSDHHDFVGFCVESAASTRSNVGVTSPQQHDEGNPQYTSPHPPPIPDRGESTSMRNNEVKRDTSLGFGQKNIGIMKFKKKEEPEPRASNQFLDVSSRACYSNNNHYARNIDENLCNQKQRKSNLKDTHNNETLPCRSIDDNAHKLTSYHNQNGICKKQEQGHLKRSDNSFDYKNHYAQKKHPKYRRHKKNRVSFNFDDTYLNLRTPNQITNQYTDGSISANTECKSCISEESNVSSESFEENYEVDQCTDKYVPRSNPLTPNNNINSNNTPFTTSQSNGKHHKLNKYPIKSKHTFHDDNFHNNTYNKFTNGPAHHCQPKQKKHPSKKGYKSQQMSKKYYNQFIDGTISSDNPNNMQSINEGKQFENYRISNNVGNKPVISHGSVCDPPELYSIENTETSTESYESCTESCTSSSGRYSDLVLTSDNRWETKDKKTHVDYSLFRNYSSTALSNSDTNNAVGNRVKGNIVKGKGNAVKRRRYSGGQEGTSNTVNVSRKDGYYANAKHRRYGARNMNFDDTKLKIGNNVNNNVRKISSRNHYSYDDDEDSVIDVGDIEYQKNNESESILKNQIREHNFDDDRTNNYWNYGSRAYRNNERNSRSEQRIAPGTSNRNRHRIRNDPSYDQITRDISPIGDNQESARNREIRQHNNTVKRIKDIIQRVKSSTTINSQSTHDNNNITSSNAIEYQTHNANVNPTIENHYHNKINEVGGASILEDKIPLQTAEPSRLVTTNCSTEDSTPNISPPKTNTNIQSIPSDHILKKQALSDVIKTSQTNQNSYDPSLHHIPSQQIVELRKQTSSDISADINKSKTNMVETPVSNTIVTARMQINSQSNTSPSTPNVQAACEVTPTSRFDNFTIPNVNNSNSITTSVNTNQLLGTSEDHHNSYITPVTVVDSSAANKVVTSSSPFTGGDLQARRYSVNRQRSNTNTIATNTSDTFIFRNKLDAMPIPVVSRTIDTQTCANDASVYNSCKSDKYQSNIVHDVANTATSTEPMYKQLEENNSRILLNPPTIPAINHSSIQQPVNESLNPFSRRLSDKTSLHDPQQSRFIDVHSSSLQTNPSHYDNKFAEPKKFLWNNTQNDFSARYGNYNYCNNTQANSKRISDDHNRKGFLDIPNKCEYNYRSSNIISPRKRYKSYSYNHVEYEMAPYYTSSDVSCSGESLECCSEEAETTNTNNNNNNTALEKQSNKVKQKRIKPTIKKVNTKNKKLKSASKKTMHKRIENEVKSVEDKIIATDTFHFIPKTMLQSKDEMTQRKAIKRNEGKNKSIQKLDRKQENLDNSRTICKTCKYQSNDCHCTCTQQ